ncbi:tyrosine-type recombinase/integrase [Streptomyces sparsus]
MRSLNPDFLQAINWNWDLRVVHFPSDHPVLAQGCCEVAGCQKRVDRAGRLCSACHEHWQVSGLDKDAFITTSRRTWRCIGQSRCQVPDCERPRRTARSGLCDAHHFHKAKRGLSLQAFLALPELTPMPGFGGCRVAACYRDRHSPTIDYCSAHLQRLQLARRRGTFDGDEDRWRRMMSSVAVSGEVSLRGLPLRIVAELLLGFQARTAGGVRTHDHWLRQLGDKARVLGLTTIEDWGTDSLNKTDRGLVRGCQQVLSRLGSTPETERTKDVWDLAVFGFSGTLNFTEIRQLALHEAVKVWAYNDIARRRGRGARSAMQSFINAIALLSESLWLQRDDHGNDHRLLGRTDVLSFCNRLGFLTENGEVSQASRCSIARKVRQVLSWMRTSGLTRPGQPLDGLPPDFALTMEDMPDEPEDTEAGRDLPEEVMQQLCDNLDLLEASSNREVRVCVEVLIDTGRRSDEAASLRWDCLDKDPDGTIVLLYDNNKSFRLGRRLPIAKETAAVITAQQQRTRERFPDTPVDQLRLFPTHRANPDGSKPIKTIWGPHRSWVDKLPDFMVPMEVLENGNPVVRMLPFDKSRIFPYAYRHSYAQRHADRGTPVDVLNVLMDHRQLSTTQGYYRVTQERRREAVDRVAALQFDRHGNRVWRKVQGLMESEHVRRAIGEVSVPYGICLEPSNVAAGGHSCPLRFRCVGCEHYRTDVSYLPDLEAHLNDLLRSRERLMSTFEADDWAKSEASPSDEEIRRIRRLIERVKADLDDLSVEERNQIEAAVATVRRGRPVMLGMPRRVSQPLPTIRPGRPA